MKQRKIPMRKCVASQEMRTKKELIRIVRTPEGNVEIDPSGKKSGRGAYLSKDKDIITEAKKKNILARHLKVEVKDEVYDQCLALAEKEITRNDESI